MYVGHTVRRNVDSTCVAPSQLLLLYISQVLCCRIRSSLISDLSTLSRKFDRWQFSTKPGWHVFKALRFSLRSEHAVSREGFCNGDAGSVADPPRWVGGQRTRIGKNLSKKYALSVANAPKRSQGRFFGDLVVDLDVKASRRRYGAERADP